MLKLTSKHLVYPLLPACLVVALYFTPKSTFGCANRGLMALGVVVVAMLCAVFSAFKYRKCKLAGNPQADWWLVSTMILLLPFVLVFGPLR